IFMNCYSKKCLSERYYPYPYRFLDHIKPALPIFFIHPAGNFVTRISRQLKGEFNRLSSH
ncbi:hypothetical protein ABLA30_23075, partial [Xenorhabdus nematophila]|uniref:hypothetical protein n=1 Tax=Xenorhabdus nematophila TaxID=628 RepID=UPI0032B881B4